MTSFSIQNFGCRVNQAEAFSWAVELEDYGLKLEEDATLAEWVIINTCTLTAKADRDVRKFIRKISRLNPNARLIIAGCSVDGGVFEGADVPPAWLYLSNVDKKELPARMLSAVRTRTMAAAKPFRSRALLKVQDGCNLRCTFCIIPQVRGRSRSLAKEDVIAEAGKLIAQGFREIVICGIHLSSYGLDGHPPSSLTDLLGELVRLEGLGRIRLSSLDPRHLDDQLIELITGSPKICPHFHLSLQHGCDRILKLMGRGSRVADYSRLLARLRKESPTAAMGADIIVGFPGETEEDFAEMESFLENSPLNYLHVFAYSARPNTPAASWPQVAEPERHRRSALLRKLSEIKRLAFRERFIGHKLAGIIIKTHDGIAEVLTPNYIDIFVSGCPGRPGKETEVRITRVEEKWTWGETVRERKNVDHEQN